MAGAVPGCLIRSCGGSDVLGGAVSGRGAGVDLGWWFEQAAAQVVQQIALLVTQGPITAEIGSPVFLSTRTVEFHLSRAYRKLGIFSRTELAGRLAGVAQGPSRPRLRIIELPAATATRAAMAMQ